MIIHKTTCKATYSDIYSFKFVMQLEQSRLSFSAIALNSRDHCKVAHSIYKRPCNSVYLKKYLKCIKSAETCSTLTKQSGNQIRILTPDPQQALKF